MLLLVLLLFFTVSVLLAHSHLVHLPTGAVDPSEGAKRVIYETIKATIEDTGKSINCEDGLQIPW